ncbi:ribosomal protein [Lithospermum erythrorhizon]|uniref:Ribosomal protein n=1 Tax=Lithospermum erythrorhizon TaxID=34254 RepID=A0AAV3QNC7_LITER
MRRAVSLHSKSLKHLGSNLRCCPISDNIKLNITPNNVSPSLYTSNLRFFSDSSTQNTDSKSKSLDSVKKDPLAGVEDVANKDLKLQIEEYFGKQNEEMLPTIIESILKRRLITKHEDTDDELMDELEMKPLDDVKNMDFEDGLADAHITDDEIEDLYSARDIVMKQMSSDPYFNMDEKKWDDMIGEAVEKGYMKDTKECENIIEDMLKWDNLLPADAKQKIEKKFNEIGDRVENGELEPEQGYALFKEFEDKLVTQLMEAEAPQFDDAVPDNKKDLDDPPGEGPVLRWDSRVVFAPGGDAWHPKNRKVKLSVTVKELGLSKHQFRRLRELVGKRYHSGKDELTITSERFEHREENRKDCMRTLLSLIEEAGKANKLVEDARTSYVKERLKSNPQFMEKLRAKMLRSRESNTISA